MSEIHLTPEQEQVLRHIQANGPVGIYPVRHHFSHAISLSDMCSIEDYFEKSKLVLHEYGHQINPATGKEAPNSTIYRISPAGAAKLYSIDEQRKREAEEEIRRQQEAQDRKREALLNQRHNWRVGIVGATIGSVVGAIVGFLLAYYLMRN